VGENWAAPPDRTGAHVAPSCRPRSSRPRPFPRCFSRRYSARRYPCDRAKLAGTGPPALASYPPCPCRSPARRSAGDECCRAMQGPAPKALAADTSEDARAYGSARWGATPLGRVPMVLRPRVECLSYRCRPSLPFQTREARRPALRKPPAGPPTAPQSCSRRLRGCQKSLSAVPPSGFLALESLAIALHGDARAVKRSLTAHEMPRRDGFRASAPRTSCAANYHARYVRREKVWIALV
jgi:hypothetical protein